MLINWVMDALGYVNPNLRSFGLEIDCKAYDKGVSKHPMHLSTIYLKTLPIKRYFMLFKANNWLRSSCFDYLFLFFTYQQIDYVKFLVLFSEQDGFSNDSKFSSLVFEDVSNIRKAAVWQYFHLDRIEHLAKCQFPDCGKLIITKNGMAALLTHLRARHNIDLKKNYRKSTNFSSEDLIDTYNQFWLWK